MPWSNTVSNFKTIVPAPQSCFILGATGEVGKCLVQQILSSSAFDRVVIVTRRSLDYSGPNKDVLEEIIIKDFDEIETDHRDILAGCQFGFCALGTTRAKAGSPEAFRKVDHDYVLTLGRLAKEGGCKWFGLVSAADANARSSFLYPRTKGETENDLANLQLPHLFVYQPGFLQCNRQEYRPLERLLGWIIPIVNFISGGRAAIPTETVARAMIIDAMETALADARGEPKVSLKIIPNKAMIDSVKLAGLV